MKRRTFLRGTTATLGLALAGCKPSDDPIDSGDTSETGDPIVPSEFQTPLPVPGELTGTLDNGRLVFELTAQAGTTEFFAGKPAATKGYNGNFLGPTLRVRRGDDVTLRVTNNLTERHVTHWHGAHLPAAADGGPHQVVNAGEVQTSEWTINQLAATIWYHPHAMGLTASQVYDGLAGFFIIDDDDADALDLPKRYGIDDFPIVVQDRRFTADGQLDYTLSMMDEHHGFQGDHFLVNGAIKPFVDVEAKQIRFRLLNGANGRTYVFSFADGTAFQLIAGDSSLLEAPLTMTQLQLSPGERGEIVVDLTDRKDDVLLLRDETAGGDLFEIRVSKEATATTTVPASLITLPRLLESEAQRTRPFIFSMMAGNFLINGVSMDMNVINEVVPVDEVEIWEITNASAMLHNFHMHAGHFEVLTRNGIAVGDWERGFKDTVFVGVSEKVRILVKHSDYTDATLPYMYHCHILEHEDTGMMGQFTVV
ncbi:MAG: multicopper oxidase domain-containing protein [Proteobacteria bacterium]|nr:multicopper oxidase domain-containing protein [Pseudomonadota bacterium]